MIGRVRRSVVSAFGPRAVHAAERGFVVGAVLTLSVTYPPLALAVVAAVADGGASFPDVVGVVEEVVDDEAGAVRSQTAYYVAALLAGAATGAYGGRFLAEVAPYAAVL
jgi:hypothetical protein